MDYNLIVTEHADSLIDSVTFHLLHNLHNPDAALHFMDGLEKVYERLAENPFQFPESRDDFLRRREYREALVPEMDYRVVFRIEDPKEVYIVGVFHALEHYVTKVE